MTTISVNELVRTRDCSVPNCTGETSHASGLCAWHHAHGTPDQFGTPGSMARLGVQRPGAAREAQREARRTSTVGRMQMVVERTARALAKATADHEQAMADLAEAQEES